MKNQLQPTLSNTLKSKLIIAIGLACSFAVCSSTGAYSQNNSFFGANAGGSAANSGNTSGSSSSTKDEDSNANAVLPGLNETATNNNPRAMGSDFTGDEKRMQKKYKDNLNNAKSLIDRGTQMMASSDKNQNSPTFKKGKVLREIGEKAMAELKANNPFPDQKTK